MKKILFLISITICLFSCKEEKEKLSFKANPKTGEYERIRGTTYSCDTTQYWHNEVIDDLQFQMLSIACFPAIPNDSTDILGWNVYDNRVVKMTRQELLSYGISTENGATPKTTTSLNTDYPDVEIGHKVILRNAGEMYIKASESGSSDIWITIPVTVTP